MDYLTYEEYQSITSNPVSLENFPKQLAAASFTLDGATNFFYANTNLETDYAPRKNAFKRAVALTIDYYNSQFNQSTSQSVTIGRTSMTEGASSNNYKSAYGNLPIDVDFILGPTGLLFKGVNTSC